MSPATIKRAASYVGLARDAWAMRRAGDAVQSRIAARHVAERLGRMRGLPQKLGQMLSLAGDADSAAPQREFDSLRDAAEPLPLETVLPLLEEAWEIDPYLVCRSIEPAAAAASLGQVHRATLNDGRCIAIKVQYPGVREAVWADLKALGWLSAPFGNLRRGFDLAAYQTVVREDMEQELDYRCELRRQRDFAIWASEYPFLVVPEPIDELCSERVLVSQWREADRWETVLREWPSASRRSLAAGLLEFFCTGVFLRGQMHADWHPGNLRFMHDEAKTRLLLYDFGCVSRPSTDTRLALLRLIRATRRGDESPFPLFLKLGFSPDYLAPLAEKLPALCRAMFEPFCADYPYDVEQWRLGQRAADILGDDRWNFRIAGPPESLLLLRAWHGLTYYMRGLGAAVCWSGCVSRCIEELGDELDGLELAQATGVENGFQRLARWMKVRVIESDRVKVDLTMPAAAIESLDSLLDEDIRAKARARGVHVSELVAAVRRGGYAPRAVFSLAEGEKRVDVWLE